MGMGGHLMWTAVARNIKKHRSETCIPLQGFNFCKSEIFTNNPNFSFSGSFQLDLSLPQTNYIKKDGNIVEFAFPKKHAVKQALEYYKIYNSIDLKCEIFLTPEEEINSNKIKKLLPKKYACIEPHSKTSWMQSRMYSFQKYQNIVNALKDKINFVQIGAPESKKLDNVIYTNGDITFRETHNILNGASFLLSTEGGLVHLANSANTKSYVIYTSYQFPEMTMYPENHCIDISLYREEILGHKIHELYLDEVKKHDESLIIELIKNENLF